MSAPLTRTCGPALLREFTYPPEILERWHAEEQAVPGAVLTDGSGATLKVARARLPPPECFDRATVRETTVALGDRTEPTDVETFAHQLRVRELLNAVGGPQSLGTLTEAIPTLAHVKAHTRLVAEVHATRVSMHEALGIPDCGALGHFRGEHERAERVMAATATMETRNSLAPSATSS